MCVHFAVTCYMLVYKGLSLCLKTVVELNLHVIPDRKLFTYTSVASVCRRCRVRFIIHFTCLHTFMIHIYFIHLVQYSFSLIWISEIVINMICQLLTPTLVTVTKRKITPPFGTVCSSVQYLLSYFTFRSQYYSRILCNICLWKMVLVHYRYYRHFKMVNELVFIQVFWSLITRFYNLSGDDRSPVL